MRGRILELWVGTSGYVYPDWVGPFYSPGATSGRMFAHYAKHFPLVELNVTFYRPPTPESLARIARRSPAGFQFVVKLHRSLSHEHDLAGAAAFRDAADVLRRDGRLLALLCQYPQSFHHSRDGLRRLDDLAGRFRDFPLAVEFRHRSWDRPEVPQWLGERGLHLVSVDAPGLPALYPSGLVQSTDLIYVRFHSRRGGTWYASDKERYDYLYSDGELTEWLDRLAARAGDAKRALLLFNNCRSGQAAQNALRIGDLVRSRPGFQLVPPFRPADHDEQGLLF